MKHRMKHHTKHDTKRLGIAVAGLAIATGAAGFAAPAASAGTTHTKVISSCTKTTYKPPGFILFCGDGNAGIEHAAYTSWHTHRAAGSGTYFFNTCKPSCAAGTVKRYKVSFTLRRTRTVHGQRLFTRLTTDHHGKTRTFDLPTKTI
jgi:hypothetical protein